VHSTLVFIAQAIVPEMHKPISPGLIFAQILAGLGLFFVGIKLLRDNLKQVTGPRFRHVLAKVSQSSLLSALWGALTGFVTQSGRVTALLLSSLIAAGTMTVRQALPMVVWSNVGCSAIVITAILPVNLLVLMVIGLGGICFAYEYPKQSKHLYSSLFGLALFMYGLGQIKLNSQELINLPVISGVITFLHKFEPAAFLFGLVITLIVQSHMGIILLVIALAAAGTFSLPEVALIIYGSHLGSSLVTWLFSIGSFQGSARQALMGQVFYNIVGVAIFIPLHTIERTTEIPLVLALVRHASDYVPIQAALLTILFNVVTSSLLILVYPLYLRLVESLYPAPVHEELSKPRYISDAYLQEPEAALELAEKEHLRLLYRLPLYLDSLRDSTHHAQHTEHHPQLGLQGQHEAFTLVSSYLSDYTAALIATHPAAQTTDRIMNLRARTAILQAIEEDLYTLTLQLQDQKPSGSLSALRTTLVEGLDTVLLTLIAAVADPDELAMLQALTTDKSSLIKSLREKHISPQAGSTPQDRIAMLDAGNLFERTIWSIGRMASLMDTKPV
jgi:phosphate:Na+ symporter